MELTATGLGTGLDIKSMVEQLVAAERQPVSNRLNLQEARANAELSALGKFKSALSTFQDSIGNLSDIDKFQKRTASVSDDTLLGASADSKAVPGRYTVEVTSLAARHKLASGAFAGSTAVVGDGTLNITVGGVTSAIEITPLANTLVNIRDAINDAPDNPGVLATIVNAQDGAHLVISSRDPGANKAITIATTGGDGGLAQLTYDAGAPSNPLSQIQAAADATAIVDGFTVTSSTNQIVDAIEGVTLDLLDAAPGTVVQVAIEYDESAANAAVGAFVNAYNSLMDTISEVTKYDPETGEAAALLGDPIVRGIKDSLRRALGDAVGNATATFRTLSDIGVSSQANGKIELNATKLADAITLDFDAVGEVFAGVGGIAVSLKDRLENVFGSTSPVTLRETRLKDQLDTLGGQRERLDERMERVQERLLRQFNAMDSLVASLQNTSSFLTRQLG